VGVAVDARPQVPRAVVEVESPQARRAHQPVEGRHRRFVLLCSAQRIAGREHVASIEAHAQPLRLADAVEYCLQVLKTTPDRRPLTGRRLQKALRHQSAGLAMDAVKGLNDPPNPLLRRAFDERPGVDHDVGNPQGLGPLEFHNVTVYRPLPEGWGRAGQIDEVRGVGQGMGQAGVAQGGTKRLGFLREDLLGPPLSIVVGEELDTAAATRLGAEHGPVVPPGNGEVGSQDGHQRRLQSKFSRWFSR
jgi:hypothetical protein